MWYSRWRIKKRFFRKNWRCISNDFEMHLQNFGFGRFVHFTCDTRDRKLKTVFQKNGRCISKSFRNAFAKFWIWEICSFYVEIWSFYVWYPRWRMKKGFSEKLEVHFEIISKCIRKILDFRNSFIFRVIRAKKIEKRFFRKTGGAFRIISKCICKILDLGDLFILRVIRAIEN